MMSGIMAVLTERKKKHHAQSPVLIHEYSNVNISMYKFLVVYSHRYDSNICLTCKKGQEFESTDD
jgi:hypothetical protein